MDLGHRRGKGRETFGQNFVDDGLSAEWSKCWARLTGIGRMLAELDRICVELDRYDPKFVESGSEVAKCGGYRPRFALGTPRWSRWAQHAMQHSGPAGAAERLFFGMALGRPMIGLVAHPGRCRPGQLKPKSKQAAPQEVVLVAPMLVQVQVEVKALLNRLDWVFGTNDRIKPYTLLAVIRWAPQSRSHRVQGTSHAQRPVFACLRAPQGHNLPFLKEERLALLGRFHTNVERTVFGRRPFLRAPSGRSSM